MIFDCDGVLLDSEAIYIAAELDFLKQAGLDYERRDYMKTFTGMPHNEWQLKLSTQAHADLGKPLDEGFFDSLNAYTMKRFETDLKVISGVRRTLTDLGLKYCVASSSSNEQLHWKLGHTGLADLFKDVVFSGDMVDKGKPEPDLFLHVASVMDVQPRRCVVVEDSCNGVMAARAADMTVIGFSGGDHCLDGHEDDLMAAGADQVIDNFADLNMVINQMIKMPKIADVKGP